MFENDYTILELEAMSPMMRMFRESLYEAKEMTKRKKASHPDLGSYIEGSDRIIGRRLGRSSIDAYIQISQARSLADHISYGNMPEMMILDDLEAKEDEVPDKGYFDAFRYSQYKEIEDKTNGFEEEYLSRRQDD